MKVSEICQKRKFLRVQEHSMYTYVLCVASHRVLNPRAPKWTSRASYTTSRSFRGSPSIMDVLCATATCIRTVHDELACGTSNYQHRQHFSTAINCALSRAAAIMFSFWRQAVGGIRLHSPSIPPEFPLFSSLNFPCFLTRIFLVFFPEFPLFSFPNFPSFPP